MRNTFGVFQDAWCDFRRTWPKLFLADLVYKLAAVVLFVPLIGVALRAFVSFSGDSVLADQDILLFVLSPIGIVALVVVAAGILAIVAIEQACLMTVGLGAVRDRNVRVSDALWLAARRSGSILALAAQIVARVLLLSAPFLAAGGAVFFWLLTEFDINYYLTERPTEFWIAAGIIAAILIGLAILLVPRLISWAYALPIHLFEELRPERALSASRERTKGNRRTVTIVLMGWVAASVLVSTLALGAVGALGRLIVPRVESSTELLVLVVGALFLIWNAMNLIVTLFQASSLSLFIVRLYERLAASQSARLPDFSTELPAGRRLRVSLRLFLGGLAVGAMLAALVGYLLIDGVRTDDDVFVIAHRGAAGRAPENTLASIQAAIEDGADFVEIDVQETADGEVVVIHDSDFMKIGGDPRKIWDVTFDEARAIDIGSWYAPEFSSERIPTLAEVLELAKGRALVDIELKYYGHDERLEERVVDVVEGAGMTSEVVIMSLEQRGLRKIRAIRPHWKIGLLAATAVGDITRVDADFLAVHAGMASSSLVNRARAVGKELYVWTVNDGVHMSRMISKGVDGLITDEPALARSVLEQRAQLSSVERLLLEVAFWLGAVPKEPPAEEDVSGN